MWWSTRYHTACSALLSASTSWLETLPRHDTWTTSQSATKPLRWILLFMWNIHRKVICRPWVMFPSLFLEISHREVSERLWTLQPWQGTRNRCQHIIPGNKWDYICRLFDREWSLGKYEPSLLVCQQCANLTINFVVLASLHTRGQTEPADCQIAVI